MSLTFHALLQNVFKLRSKIQYEVQSCVDCLSLKVNSYTKKRDNYILRCVCFVVKIISVVFPFFC